MRRFKTKITLTMLVLIAALLILPLFQKEFKTDQDGLIRIIVIDVEGQTVYDDFISFIEGDSVMTLLQNGFSLTCASATYQEDPECTHVFQMGAHYGFVILGIGHEDFEIMTNWYDTFIAIELFDGEKFYLSSYGISQIPFKDGDVIRFVEKSTSGNTS